VRTSRFRSAALLLISACSRVEPPPQAVLDASMRRVADQWLAAHADPGPASWNAGVHYQGLTALYRETRDARYFDRVHQWGVANGWQPYGGVVTQDADSTVCGMAYWDQQEAGDPSAVIANVEPSILAQRDATYGWIDLFFMGFPLSARYGHATGDTSMFDGVNRIFAADRAALYDPAQQLWWRDGSWSGSGVYWSRGNGWVLAGLAGALEWMPQNGDIVAVAKSMAGRLRVLQGADGLWRSALIPADGYDSSSPEASGTALDTLAIAKLVRLGLLDRATWLPVANAAWSGLASVAVQADGTLGYCQPGSDRPSARALTSSDTADFCVGAFLLAGSELSRLR